MSWLSWNLGASISWKPQGLYRPVMGLIYLYLLLYVPPSLTQKDSTFCIKSECMCFVWFFSRPMKSGFFLILRSESWPGLRNCVRFRLWSGRPGAETPQGRQEPVADHLHKFGAGVKYEWSCNSPYVPSWSVHGKFTLFALLTDWIL